MVTNYCFFLIWCSRELSQQTCLREGQKSNFCMKNKIPCNVHPASNQLPTYSFCRVSNSTMATASNLYLARSYLTFVKFDILTAMTVKVLTFSVSSISSHKNKKGVVLSSETSICFTDLHWMKFRKKIHFSYSCAVFCAPAVLRDTGMATFQTYNLYIFLDNFILVRRLWKKFWPQTFTTPLPHSLIIFPLLIF